MHLIFALVWLDDINIYASIIWCPEKQSNYLGIHFIFWEYNQKEKETCLRDISELRFILLHDIYHFFMRKLPTLINRVLAAKISREIFI